MTTVFRVYAMKEDGFTVIIDDEGRRTRMYDVTEHQVRDILRATQVPATYGDAMSLSQYKKQYKA